MVSVGAVAEFAIAESRSDQPGRAGFDIAATIISQYANSPIICRLVKNFGEYFDPTKLIDDFYNNIWNIETAQGFGLDVWGRIVGVSRTLHLPQPGTYLGFRPASDAHSFNEGIFFNDQATITTNFNLSDNAYRRLILAKALSNITDGGIAAINQILLNLFGQGYVVDNRDMTITYTFTSRLSPVDYAIATQSGVLPKPAGVAVNYVVP